MAAMNSAAGFARPESKRDAVIRAAAEEFLARGFREATVQGIAARLGISKGGAHYHIGSKEQLYFEIIISGMANAVARLEEIVEYPIAALDRLRLAMRDMIRLGVEEPRTQLASLALRNLDALPVEQREHFVGLRDRYRDLVVGLIDEATEAGECRPLPDPKVIVFGILGLYSSLRQWYHPGGNLSPMDIADIWWDLVMNGLRPIQTDSRMASPRPNGR